MKKLTIVGAGVSGLYLATLLEKSYEVTIIEARERIGGRIYSIEGNDMGPSWIWSHQKHLLGLVNDLGLELFSQFYKGYSLYDTKGKVEKFHPQPSAPSARMKGTLSALVHKLYENLETTKILFGEELIKVEEKENSISIKTQRNRYESDFIILTLPPRLVSQLTFEPALPSKLLNKFQNTQTWMGNSAKCVVEFTKNFWKEQGLSGFVFSHIGPLGEIHDASEDDKHALFGFVHANADMQNFEKDVLSQMIRLFEIEESDIKKIYLVDWRKEIFSAVAEDSHGLTAHPEYGIDTSEYSQKILFSATEFSYDNGGYIEGSISLAKSIAKRLTAQA